MKKSQFIFLLVGVVGGLLFSLGMCMCLLPDWHAFTQGMVVGAVGGVILLVLGGIGLVRALRGRKHIAWKTVGKVCYGVLSSLMFGAGMCLVMVWNFMIPGIAVGVVGIVMLLCLIPMCIGFRKD